MNFLGVIANAVGVLVFGVAGTYLGKRIPAKVGETLISGLALCVTFIAIGGIKTNGNIILAVISIALGGVIGELADFDFRIQNFGEKMQKLFGHEKSSFGEGFVSATLLFCIGAMGIVGSLESGMNGNPDTLLAKSLIDSIIVLIMASTMGIGCALAAVPLFVYQGSMTLLAGLLASYLPEQVITEMSFVGSILILGVGLNMLGITKIKVGNLILAPFFPIFLQQFWGIQ